MNSELRKKLKERIYEAKLKRSNKQTKEDVVDRTLKTMGVDKEKLKKDLEELKKVGGLSIDLNK